LRFVESHAEGPIANRPHNAAEPQPTPLANARGSFAAHHQGTPTVRKGHKTFASGEEFEIL
jgi:hypothetical protein